MCITARHILAAPWQHHADEDECGSRSLFCTYCTHTCRCVWAHKVFLTGFLGFPGDASDKEPACQGSRRGFDPRVGEDPLEEGVATHFGILPCRIPGKCLAGYTSQSCQESGSTGESQHARTSGFMQIMKTAILAVTLYPETVNKPSRAVFSPLGILLCVCVCVC